MIALVTGAAGFVGSTLTDSLLKQGHTVRGVDNFSNYYERAQKEDNLSSSLANPRFSLEQGDLRIVALDRLFQDVDVVFHLSGQPGVRRSWSEFEVYVKDNILVTHRLLEAARASKELRRFVYASSSSVYGNATGFPTQEDARCLPHSPYGITKLAAEELCSVYAANWGTPTLSLRYFTVYGPRQRPDMAFHRMFESALSGTPFPLYGAGRACRSFTFVQDVVRATELAGLSDIPSGTVLNVAGDVEHSMAEVIEAVNDAVGKPLMVDMKPDQPGDVERTGGSIERARSLLGWSPTTGLCEGLARQLAWHEARRIVG